MSSKTETISTQQWMRLQEVFDQAMELPAEERTAYVAQVCDTEALRNQVEALLLAAESEHELVGSLIRSAADSVLGQSATARESIGTFRIVKVIGTGGMGVVYLALRDDDEFHQKVAIKILHDGIVTEEAIQRFRTERQILAELNHPNIAKLLDGGHTEDGKPYLVMEYVDGEPITDYCDRLKLGVSERLDLFTQVCSAVAAAHRSLIVHRDIKPSNILIGKDGVPKLLDFGIAKVLDNRLHDVDLAKTQLHERLLTPDNASPEQVTGRPVTTASDIYSLGILLYQLLCGSRPFRLVDVTPAEMEKIICDEVPLLPSKAIGGLDGRDSEDQQEAVACRSTTIAKLQRDLRGDLDNIVMKAIKKEPQKRYMSASQFASDIGRYHRGLPLVAANDTRRYRAAKFISRNRFGVAAAAIFVAALSLFSLSTYLQAQKILERNEITEETLEFVNQFFKSASPERLQKKEVTAIDILNVGADKLLEIDARPELKAKLHTTLGLGFSSQGSFDQALIHLNEALDVRRELYGSDHPQVADVLQNLGDYYGREGQWDLAEQHYDEALGIFRNKVSNRYFRNNRPKQQMAVENLLTGMAGLEMQRGRWEAAGQRLNEAEVILDTLKSHHLYSSERITLLETRGVIYRRIGQYDQSILFLEEALDLAKTRFGPDHTNVSGILDDLALTHHARGELDLAEGYYQESLAIKERVFGEGSETLAQVRFNFGRFLRDKGELAQARQVLKKLVDSHALKEDELPYSASLDMLELAKVHMALTEFDEAESLFARTFELLNQTLKGDHQFIAEALRQHGNFLMLKSLPDESLTQFDAAAAMLKRMGTENHWQMAATRSEKSEALLQMSRPAEAVELLEMALPALEATVGAGHRLYREASERITRANEALRLVNKD